MALYWFQVDGLADVEDNLERLVGIGGREFAADFLEGVGLIAEKRVARSFEEMTAPDYVVDIGEADQYAGVPWQPLSEWTEANRREGPKTGRPNQALQDFGNLKGSIETILGGDYIEIGTGVFYGEYQHGGTRDHWVGPRDAKALRFFAPGGAVVFSSGHEVPGISPRPFVGVNDSDFELMDTLAYTLVEALLR